MLLQNAGVWYRRTHTHYARHRIDNAIDSIHDVQHNQGKFSNPQRLSCVLNGDFSLRLFTRTHRGCMCCYFCLCYRLCTLFEGKQEQVPLLVIRFSIVLSILQEIHSNSNHIIWRYVPIRENFIPRENHIYYKYHSA